MTEQTPAVNDEAVEAAIEAYWPAYSAAVRAAPSNRNGQGITSDDAKVATRAGYRAALTAALPFLSQQVDPHEQIAAEAMAPVWAEIEKAEAAAAEIVGPRMAIGNARLGTRELRTALADPEAAANHNAAIWEAAASRLEQWAREMFDRELGAHLHDGALVLRQFNPYRTTNAARVARETPLTGGGEDWCRHGEREGDCPSCAACDACRGECGVCPYALSPAPEGEKR
jgi:hypothetical protein